MARDWHEQFRTWAKAPSDTEEEKARRAARMINDALRENGTLAGRNFKVYATGSYRNNTNIRLGSDMDMAVVFGDAFFYELPAGRRPEEFGLGQGVSYGLDEFRRDVGHALAAKFGTDVSQGNKTFTIRGNTGRLPADATAFLPHRQYTGQLNADRTAHYYEGVETRPLKGGRIINWHQDHYDNGVAKNMATGRRFKRVARILKQLREDMSTHGTQAARAAALPMASFLLECIPYNAGDANFNLVNGSYYEDVKAVVRGLWHATKDDQAARSLVEVNGRKVLFGTHQGWTRAEANAFLLNAWNHVGFK